MRFCERVRSLICNTYYPVRELIFHKYNGVKRKNDEFWTKRFSMNCKEMAYLIDDEQKTVYAPAEKEFC